MMAVNKDKERVKSLFDLEDDEDKTDGENLINPDVPTPGTTCTTATTDDIDEEFSDAEDDQLKKAVEEYEEKTSGILILSFRVYATLITFLLLMGIFITF